MEDNQNINGPHKIRKIKRIKIKSPQPTAYGTPTKVNFLPQSGENAQLETGGGYFADNGDSETIRFVTNEELLAQEPMTIAEYLSNKTVLMLLLIAGLVGALFTYLLAPSHSTATGRGLDGIVFNQDVPSGRSRCGLVEPHQGCVLYIMNPKNQEIPAKDFYTTAAKWTGRQLYLIETGNMHYGNKRIKPGYIAQINIPPLS